MDDMEENLFTFVNFKFKTIRIIDSVIVSNKCTLKAELIVSEDAPDSDIAQMFDKANYWFDSIMENCILIDRDNDIALSTLFMEDGSQRIDNFPMMLPGEPVDTTLVKVLHSKLSAFGGDNIAFGILELTSDTRENIITTYTGYGEHELPSMAEWVGERSFHSKPWWARPNGDVIDLIPTEDADLSNPPPMGVDMSHLERDFSIQPEQAAIIRPNFNPKVISGGLDDPSQD